MTIPNDPGTYRLRVGDSFLLGSTTDLRAAHADHRDLLRKGDHPVPDLQVAWWALGDDGLRFEVVEVLPRKPEEDDTGLRRRLRLHEQWELDRVFGRDGCCNQSSDSGYNTNASEVMKAKWADPEWAARMREKIRKASRKGCEVSAETRRKMAEAKRGKRNPKARAVWLRLPSGEERQFGCASDAARAVGVKQQVMDLWLRGKVAWPGQGGTPRTEAGRRLVGLVGGYVD